MAKLDYLTAEFLVPSYAGDDLLPLEESVRVKPLRRSTGSSPFISVYIGMLWVQVNADDLMLAIKQASIISDHIKL